MNRHALNTLVCVPGSTFANGLTQVAFPIVLPAQPATIK